MPAWRGIVWTVVLLAVLWTGVAWAGTQAQTLGPSDWQYKGLDSLSRAGLLNGHPKGPMADWAGERLSRFEAASLTLRAVEGLGKAYQQQGQALEQMARGESGGETTTQLRQQAAEATGREVAGASPCPTTAGELAAAPSSPAGATMDDVARVEKLIEEFRTELVTMGARVDDLATAIKGVQTRLAKVEAERKQHQIDGYMQLRFQDDKATSGQRDFMVRTARVNVRGPVSDKVSYRIEMQFDSKETGMGPGSRAQLRTATIDYLANPVTRVRVGQMTLPWGYELEYPTPQLWSGERAFFMDRLFPDQRDLGLDVNYQRSPKAPKFDVGSFNGTGIDVTDNNHNQNFMGRVDVPFKNGSVALSGYTGTSGEGAARIRQDRDGIGAKYQYCDTQFMGEWVTGDDRGKEIRGWYAQVGHPVTNKASNLLFAKYDTYDENRAVGNDLFKRWSLGYWYQLDKATRLTFAYERRDVDKKFSDFGKWNGNAGWVQLQVEY